MKIDQNVKYAKTHEWVKYLDEKTALVGLSDYAQEQLGDIVFVSVNEGDQTKGEAMGDVESVKAVSDLYSPLTGKVVEINPEVIDHPEKINEDPYGTWIAKISEITDCEELLSSSDYEKIAK